MKFAIYSRKSVITLKGESVENQIEMCKEYCIRTNNKVPLEFVIYEDEGYSGKNSNRPNFKRLLNDIKREKFTALICYRLDRISRSVADFSSTLDLLQKYNVDFISVKEQFDTSTALGRAMVYISSVFAQLERETIAERVKDNMLELSKTGRWLGGQKPLGFNSEKICYINDEYKEKVMQKLTPIEEELSIVKLIYSKYLLYKSIPQVQKELLTKDICGKNGGEFSKMSIYDILRNPVYVKSDKKVKVFFEDKSVLFCGVPNGNGILTYNKKRSGKYKRPTNEWIAAVSMHKGIIHSKSWLQIQEELNTNNISNKKRSTYSKTALLSGIIKCSNCKSNMRISYGRKRNNGTQNHYYICSLKAKSSKVKCNNPNANGRLLEINVLNELFFIYRDKFIDFFKNTTNVICNDNKSLENFKKSLHKKTNILLSQLCNSKNENTKSIILKKIDDLNSTIENSNNKNNLDNSFYCGLYPLLNNSSNFNPIYEYLESSPYFQDDSLKASFKKFIILLVDNVFYDGVSNKIDIIKKNL